MVVVVDRRRCFGGATARQMDVEQLSWLIAKTEHVASTNINTYVRTHLKPRASGSSSNTVKHGVVAVAAAWLVVLSLA